MNGFREDGDTVTVGITHFAQNQLADLTYVDLPTIGERVIPHDEVVVVESVKAASDIYAPVSGTISEVNNQLVDNPELINTDPYGEGWIFKITITDPSEVKTLLDADGYEDLLPEED